MPEERAEPDLVPGTDAGQRRVDHHPARDAVGILRGERIAYHVADVVRHEIGFPDSEMVHDARDVERLVLFRVAGVGMGREAHAAQVGRDDGVILREHGGGRRPHVARVGEAVQHDDGWAASPDADMQCRAVRRYVFGAKVGREGHDGSGGDGNNGNEKRAQERSENTRHLYLSRRRECWRGRAVRSRPPFEEQVSGNSEQC